MTADSKPFVSVIIPTHRRREMLLRLLRSLLAQDYPTDRCEILVVHNWTGDGTEEAVAELSATTPIAIGYWKKNYPGPTDSRQFAIGEARGDIIAFVDDDCEASVGWITAGVAAFGPGIGIVQGRTIPRPDQPRRFIDKTIEVVGPTTVFETCNIFYARAAIMAVGGFSPEYLGRWCGEDTDLGWKVKREGWGCGFAAGALVHHEVFIPSLAVWLMEPARVGAWPELVRKFPEIRATLWRRYFLTAESAAFDLALLAVVAAVALHPAAMIGVGPYVALRWTNGKRFGSPLLRIARIVLGLPRAFVIFGALARNSIRMRTLVL